MAAATGGSQVHRAEPDRRCAELDRKASSGQIDGEKQARGIAQGMLKATCAALAHLSKEYDGQLAAERWQIHRSMLQQPDVMNYIADGDAATAYGLLCKRTPFQPWLLKKGVKKAIVVSHDALARPFTTTCSGGRVYPTSNASADQSPIAGLFADAAGRGAGRMADAGRRAAQTAALRSLLSTASWPG